MNFKVCSKMILNKNSMHVLLASVLSYVILGWLELRHYDTVSSGPPLRPPRHHGPHGLLLREHSPVGAPPRPGHRAQFGGLLPRDSCILGRPFKRPRVDCGPFGALGWLGRPRERPSSARPFQLCSRWRHARVLKPWPPGSRPKRPDIGALPAAQEDGHGHRRGGLRDRG